MAERVAFLVALGLLQALAELMSLPTLERLASATMASPPLAREGCRIQPYVVWSDGGRPTESPIRAEDYARLEGPVARRNAYRTAVACGPMLEDDPARAAMWRAVMRAAFCSDAPLLDAMKLPIPRGAAVRIRYEPFRGAGDSFETQARWARTIDRPCR